MGIALSTDCLLTLFLTLWCCCMRILDENIMHYPHAVQKSLSKDQLAPEYHHIVKNKQYQREQKQS